MWVTLELRVSWSYWCRNAAIVSWAARAWRRTHKAKVVGGHVCGRDCELDISSVVNMRLAVSHGEVGRAVRLRLPELALGVLERRGRLREVGRDANV